jgi:hypothetical protein
MFIYFPDIHAHPVFLGPEALDPGRLNMSEPVLATGVALLLLVAFTSLAVASVLVVHRFFPGLRLGEESSGFGQIFAGAIGTMFALVFALVTIAVWGSYDKVNNGVGDEANCINNIYCYLEPYQPAMREATRGLLRTYLKEVVTHEWSLLADGKEDPEAHRLITEFNARITAYHPASLGEVPLHGEMLTQVSKYRALRHDRLRAAVPYLDASMWVALGAGTLILLGFCSVWKMASMKHHLLMAAALGASLGVLFYLMVVYNHPFQRPAAIGPDPLQTLLDKDWNGS